MAISYNQVSSVMREDCPVQEGFTAPSHRALERAYQYKLSDKTQPRNLEHHSPRIGTRDLGILGTPPSHNSLGTAKANKTRSKSVYICHLQLTLFGKGRGNHGALSQRTPQTQKLSAQYRSPLGRNNLFLGNGRGRNGHSTILNSHLPCL